MLRCTLLALTLFTLSACTSPDGTLQQLRQAKVSDDPYFKTLTALYQAYAEAQRDAYDWDSSAHFAQKGLDAAYAKPLQPEDPAMWLNLAHGIREQLAGPRTKLQQLLNENTQKTYPKEMAHAMMAYDCWVETADDGGNVSQCQGDYEGAIKAIANAKAVAAAKKAEEEKLKTQIAVEQGPVMPAVQPQPFEPESSILYFPFDSAELDATARPILRDVIAYIKDAGSVNININGHADRAGSEEYNLPLSERRAAYVRDALVRSGITPDNIQAYGFGESDPVVMTEDGVQEPRNRRVEIFLEK